MPLVERTINSARNPKWTDYSQTRIELEVDFDELDEVYVPFCADPNDIVSWGPELYNRALAGEFGPVEPFDVPSDVTGDDALMQIRGIRDALLKEDVDPIVSNALRWAEMTTEKQQEWATYRQELLDLPETQSSAYMTFDTQTESLEWVNLTLPTKPE